MDVVFSWITQYGSLALFALLMLGIAGLPVPDETVLTFAGYLIFKHELALVPTAAAAVMGSICGITLSYSLGWSFGPYLVQRIGRVIRIQPQDLDRMRAWYVRWGKYTLLVGYFVPGIRHLAALVAGSSRLPLTVFTVFAYTGAVLWSGTFLTLGYVLGEEWVQTSATIHRLLAFAAGIGCVVLAVLFFVWRRSGRD